MALAVSVPQKHWKAECMANIAKQMCLSCFTTESIALSEFTFEECEFEERL